MLPRPAKSGTPNSANSPHGRLFSLHPYPIRQGKPILPLSLFCILFFLFAQAGFASAATLHLPQDPFGWSIFTPSPDTRIVYVSATGNDATGQVYTSQNHPCWKTPFAPPANIRAFATHAAAHTQTREGHPDWILIKRGDVFQQRIGDRLHSGRSSTEPFLIGAYGDSGPSPLFRTGAESGIRRHSSLHWIVLSGLSFYAHTRDPDNPEFIGTDGGHGIDLASGDGASSRGILIEGCVFRQYTSNQIGVLNRTKGSMEGVVIRRSLFLDNYAAGWKHSQGLWSWGSSNLTMEECIFDHNGWYSGHGGAIGHATVYNHNTYLASVNNVTLRGNLFLRPSCSGNKFTAEQTSHGLIITDNLYVDNEIGISMGINYLNHLNRLQSPTITGNVFTLTGRTGPTGSRTGWGVWISGWDGGIIGGNLFLDHAVTLRNGATFYVYGHNRNVRITGNLDMDQNHSSRAIHIAGQNQEASRGMHIYTNTFIMTGDTARYVESDQNLDGFTFAGNIYAGQNQGFFQVRSTALDAGQWRAARENRGRFLQPLRRSNKGDIRDIPGYMREIGQPASLDAFYAAVRKQDRYNWDDRLLASSINKWLREGYGMARSATCALLPPPGNGE